MRHVDSVVQTSHDQRGNSGIFKKENTSTEKIKKENKRFYKSHLFKFLTVKSSLCSK